MAMNRRDFLKIMGGTTAAIAFPTVMIQGCKKALEKVKARTNVIWIQAQSCSGCSVSLLNKVNPDIATVITEYISLNYHQTLMGGTGDAATQVLKHARDKKRKDFVLIVEGSIPMDDEYFCTIGVEDGIKNKKHISAQKWVEELGKNAAHVISVGTCATYGGIPGAIPNVPNGKNPTGAVGVAELFKKSKDSTLRNKPVVNIPGCPPHPDWMVGSLLFVLLNGKYPKLDEFGRPTLYFGKTVHETCERLNDYKQGVYAKEWGDKGCLYQLGCLGMDSGCDIPVRKWVGVNSCTDCGAGCIGCTEPVFPDYGKRGIFQHLNASNDELQLLDKTTQETISKLKDGGVING